MPTDLLPGDVELARRAAGGDGAAFVYLYDRYSADVFTVSLAATGEVEAAADATQSAFLTLLRRPPAMAAPSGEVGERLRALALGTASEAPAVTRRTARGTHAPLVAGVGWLRSETVAKAGARFDDDWSVHLADRPAERVTSERPLPAPAPSARAPVAAANPLPPRRTPLAPRRPRRTRPGWLALPSPAVAAAFVLLPLLTAATGVVLLSGGGTAGEQPAPRATAVAREQPPIAASAARETRPRARRTGATAGHPAQANALQLLSAARRFAGDRGVVRLSRPTARRNSPGAQLRVLTQRTGGQAPHGIVPGGRRTPTAVKAPEPPAPAPAPTPVAEAPAQTTEPAPPTPVTEPAPTTSPERGNRGENRNCNSKKAAPC